MEKSNDQAIPAWGIKVGVAIGVIAVLALFSKIILAAATAGAGLLALGVIGVAGLGFVQAIPWLGQKWENKLLALRKAEARENPIEQLQNFFKEKRESVNRFKAAVSQIWAQVMGLDRMIQDRLKAKPNAEVSRQKESLEAMKKVHATLKQKYVNAENALVQLQDVIEDRKFEWNFAQAGQSAINAMNATSGEDLINLMLADEAHASILNNFNTVFADLDMEAAKLTNNQTQDFGNGIVLDMSTIQLTNLYKVPA